VSTATCYLLVFATVLFVTAGLFVSAGVGVATLIEWPSICDCWVNTVVVPLHFFVLTLFGLGGAALES
jgi:hypothetical protein